MLNRRPFLESQLFSDNTGNVLVQSLLLMGMVSSGAYLASHLTHTNAKSERYKAFNRSMVNVRLHAEKILTDPLACEDAFKGQAMPKVGVPVRSKRTKSEIRPLLLPGWKGPTSLMVGNTYQAGTLRLTDLRLVAKKGEPGKFAFEVAGSASTLLAGILGGDKQLIRSFDMIVKESTTTPGKIQSCSVARVEQAAWDELCEAAGTRYDSNVGTCTACPGVGEQVVGWRGPVTPICKTVEQQVCEAMGSDRAYWDETKKKCFQCAFAYQVLQVSGGVPQCDDSIDTASFAAIANSDCPAGQAKQTYLDNGIMRFRCR